MFDPRVRSIAEIGSGAQNSAVEARSDAEPKIEFLPCCSSLQMRSEPHSLMYVIALDANVDADP